MKRRMKSRILNIKRVPFQRWSGGDGFEFAGAPPGRAATKGSIRHFVRVRDRVDYWEGER